MKKILLLMFIINISVFGTETLNRIFPMREYYVEGEAFTGTLEYGDLKKSESEEIKKIAKIKKVEKKHTYVERGEYKDGFLEKAVAYLNGKEIGHIIYDKGKLVSEYIEGNSEYISEENAPTLKLAINDNTFGLWFVDIYKGKESIKVENGKTVYKQFINDKVFEAEYKHIITNENSEENYKLDTKAGVIAKEYKNGILTGEFTEKEDINTGDMIVNIKTYYDDGTPMRKAKFVNKIQSGEHINYFSNGQIETQEMYEEGRNTGILRRYYQNGNLYQEIKYDKDGFSGEIKEYYDTGELYGEGTVIYNEKSNDFKVYDKEKNLLMEPYYYEGELVGSQYTEKGKEHYKEYIGRYKYVKDGVVDTTEYPEKDLYYEKETQPKREGEYEIYYDNGFLKEKVVYVNGRETGKVQNYDRNGSKLEVIDYDAINEKDDEIKKLEEEQRKINGEINKKREMKFKILEIITYILGTVLIVIVYISINRAFSEK